jgi:hypothetical protein
MNYRVAARLALYGARAMHALTAGHGRNRRADIPAGRPSRYTVELAVSYTDTHAHTTYIPHRSRVPTLWDYLGSGRSPIAIQSLQSRRLFRWLDYQVASDHAKLCSNGS